MLVFCLRVFGVAVSWEEKRESKIWPMYLLSRYVLMRCTIGRTGFQMWKGLRDSVFGSQLICLRRSSTKSLWVLCELKEWSLWVH